MKFLKKAMEEAKKVPRSAWIASVILPGGFIALGVYFAAKSLSKKVEKPILTVKDIINEWKKDDRS